VVVFGEVIEFLDTQDVAKSYTHRFMNESLSWQEFPRKCHAKRDISNQSLHAPLFRFRR
jgi:hypothetical protein